MVTALGLCTKYQWAYYSFGKMNWQKCKPNFMILQTNLQIISSNFIGIVNQVNQFNLNFQPTSLHICCEKLHEKPIFTTSKNQFHKLYNFISQRTIHHIQDSPSCSPQLVLPKFILTSRIQPWTMSIMIACTSSLMWLNDIRWFWRLFRRTWLSMCPNVHYASLKNGLYDGKRK